MIDWEICKLGRKNHGEERSSEDRYQRRKIAENGYKEKTEHTKWKCWKDDSEILKSKRIRPTQKYSFDILWCPHLITLNHTFHLCLCFYYHKNIHFKPAAVLKNIKMAENVELFNRSLFLNSIRFKVLPSQNLSSTNIWAEKPPSHSRD